MSPQLGDLLTRQVSDHPICTTQAATCLDPIPSEPLGYDKELTLYLEVQVKIMITQQLLFPESCPAGTVGAKSFTRIT